MKPRNRNQNLASSSRECLTSNNRASCSNNSKTKSKLKSNYCMSTGELEAATKMNTKLNNDSSKGNLEDTHEESPYRTSITEIRNYNANTTLNEDQDFKTPKPINKIAFKMPDKSSPKKNVKGAKSRRKIQKPRDSKKSKQMVFKKKTPTKNSDNADVNPEHLQLAIALSRSLQDSKREKIGECKDDLPSTSAYPSTQQKIATIRETLGQFGLKADTSKINVKNRRPPIEKKNKKSRHRDITPVLLLRTQEDREKIISDKVASIISNNQYGRVRCSKLDIELVSSNLQKYRRHDNKIFKMTGFESGNSINFQEFYVKHLNIPATKAECGRLLKGWDKIPGRQLTPCRNIETTGRTKASKQECQNLVSSNEEVGLNSDSPEITRNDPIQSPSTTTTPNKINSLGKMLKNNLKIWSFEDRSVSPDLFDSDDEIAATKSKSSQQKQLLDSSPDSERSSPSLLNLTPSKHKYVQAITDDNVASEECSESLLNITPTKRKSFFKNVCTVTESKAGLNGTVSPLEKASTSFHTSSEYKCKLSGLLDDDLFENDNGICTFESFSEPHNYFDLIHSSSDECNHENTLEQVTNSSNKTSSMRQTILENTQNLITDNNSCGSSSKTGITECFQKSVCVDESFITDDAHTAEQSNLNVTDYICNMLNENQGSIMNTSVQDDLLGLPRQNFEASENEVDLTQSSNDSADHLIANESHGICSKRQSSKRISNSSTSNPVSPIKPHINEELDSLKFQKHDSFRSTTSEDINLSQESIYISDEELNYSSVYGTPCNNQRKQAKSHKDKLFYELSEESDSEQNNMKESNTSTDHNATLDYTPKTSKEFWKPDNSNNEEDSITKVKSPTALPININDNTVDQQNTIFNYLNHSPLQHPRLKNLSRENTPTGQKCRKHLFDGNSFNVALENSSSFPSIQESPTKPTIQTADTQNSKPSEATTPKSEMIIKTTNVTPMANYAEMDSPTVVNELQKFGIKPLKRQRGVQILKHIYESTHPIVGNSEEVSKKCESDEDQRATKKRKTTAKTKNSCRKSRSPKINYLESNSCTGYEMECISKISGNNEKRGGVNSNKTNAKAGSAKTSQSPRKSGSPQMSSPTKNMNVDCEKYYFGKTEQIEIVGDLMTESETVEDLIFERKQSAKIPSCRVPLHIAWHNLVSSQPDLRKNILLYEPLQLEVLYMTLKEQGYKYHIKDLLTFLDRKCITIRTDQNSNRGRKRQKKLSPSKNS